MKKFLLCMIVCLMTLTAYAANNDLGCLDPPKVKINAPTLGMAAPVFVVMDFQSLNVVSAPVLFLTANDAPVSMPVNAMVMAAYIEKKAYWKKFQPPNYRSKKGQFNHYSVYNRNYNNRFYN